MTIYDADFVAEEMLQNKYTPGVEDFAAESQAVADQGTDDSQVPMEHSADAGKMIDNVSEKELNFRALRESIANEKHERELERQRHQHELEIMRSQIAEMSRTTNEDQVRRPDALDGLRDDDILTVEAFKKAQQQQHDKYQEEIQALRYENLENRARLQFSDYNEVMEKYSIPLLRNNRDFARAFQMAENPAEFAYQLGKMQMGQVQPQQQMQQTQINKAERIIENARKPGTLSSARGGQAQLSKADYYGSMSDAEFISLMNKNLEEV